jgi:hypothetical protein
MQQAYLMYKSQGAPDERLDLFRRWMTDADALLKGAQQAAQAEVMAQQASIQGEAQLAQAVPEAPPTSDLLPNIPQ